MPGPSVDLLALLRPTQVSVRVAGHAFTLEATTAAHWIGAIAMDMDDLYGIIPGLIGDEDLELMYELSQTHTDITTRWFYAARKALGRAAGRDWWWARNLSRKSLNSWSYVNGALLRQGVDAKKVGYPDWLDACYSMLWQGCHEEDQRIKLDLELGAKPRGEAVIQSPAATRQMLAEFAAD